MNNRARAPITLHVAGAVPLGEVRLEGRLLRDGKEVAPTGDRRIEWTPGKVSTIDYSFEFPEPGAYMLRLSAFKDGQAYPLGREVSAYSPVVEIPIVVGKLAEGKVAMAPWPKKTVAYPPIPSRNLALPVVAEAKAFRVAAPHPTEKIFREDRLAPDAPRMECVREYLAGGEWESVQLIVFPMDGKALARVQVEVPPLRQATSGAVLDRIRVFKVSHVTTRIPSNYAYIPVGRYPDPLFPLVEALDVPAGENAGIWIDIQAPLNAPAGEYTGEIRITTGDTRTAIPLAVKVWAFNLPSPPALKTSAGAVGSRFKKAFEALHYPWNGKAYEEYLHWCLDYGFAPGHGRPTNAKEFVDWKTYNRGISAIVVGGNRVYPWATAEYMKTNGFEGRMWVYAEFDEHGDATVPKVAAWAQGFREKWPYVKILDVYYGNNTGPLEGLVDIWCRSPHGTAWEAQRMKAGDEFWSVNGQLLWGVEDEVFPGRKEYWQIFSRGYTGQLLWSMCATSSEPPDFNGLGCNALAMLLYPSPTGLTTSIRWDTMRDGLEDYDYLAVLKRRATAAAGKADPGLLAAARRICDDPALRERIADKVQLEKLRQEIGSLIEKLTQTAP